MMIELRMKWENWEIKRKKEVKMDIDNRGTVTFMSLDTVKFVCISLDGVDSMVARLDVASLTKYKEIVSLGVHGCKLERWRNVKKVGQCEIT